MAMGSWTCWYDRLYKREDLPLESTSLDAVTTWVKTGINCPIMLLVFFIVDPLEMLSFFCVSVLYKGIWDFFIKLWWQYSKTKILIIMKIGLTKLFLVHFFCFYRQEEEVLWHGVLTRRMQRPTSFTASSLSTECGILIKASTPATWRAGHRSRLSTQQSLFMVRSGADL